MEIRHCSEHEIWLAAEISLLAPSSRITKAIFQEMFSGDVHIAKEDVFTAAMWFKISSQIEQSANKPSYTQNDSNLVKNTTFILKIPAVQSEQKFQCGPCITSRRRMYFVG
jgi:hypothetical protein